MKHRIAFAIPICALLLVSSVPAAPSTSEDYVKRGERCWQDVKVLADDSMEGRQTGSPGHRRAAEYVADQFRRANLAPGGEGGFFQPVQLEVRQIVEPKSALALVRGEQATPLKLGEDAIYSLRGNFSPRLEAPMVFVGYGLKLPQYGVDDLAGIDLKGKVIVTFQAAPTGVPGAAGAHFGSPQERWKVYRAAGAVGLVIIPNPFNMDLPWERVALARVEPFMVLKTAGEDQFEGQQVWVTFNPARISRLLEGSEHKADDLLAKLKAGEPLPRFELSARIRSTVEATISQVTSENVVGILPGTDPKVANERVVISAHLDHLGIGSEGTGDRLFNGAMDNASGVAVLMQIARDLQAQKTRPRRTIVFAAVTAEEKGLLGSRAYVSQALRRSERIVADLNTDMFLPLYPLKQLVVFGLEESDLGEDARAVAKSMNIEVQSDPQPLRNRFIRSDQYSFIRAGIPSLALKVGLTAGSPQAAIESKWFAERYHAPADSPDQPVDLSAVGTYEELLKRLAVRVADRAQAPRWNATSVFGGGAAGTTTASAAVTDATPIVMVCEHGSVKSLVAASLFNQAAAARNLPYRAIARGMTPDSSVPPAIASKLKQEGFDVDRFTPTRVATTDLSRAARVVAIGVDLSALTPAKTSIDAWNDVPAASTDYAAAHASLKRHVDALLIDLQAHQPP
jgi:protein-tyrosine-phosphatase